MSKSVFAKKSDDEITETIIAPSRIQLAILFLALSGFVIFGYDFLVYWIGDSYSTDMLKQAYIVGCVVMGSATWQLFQNSATNILKAKNILRGKVIITGVATIGNFIVTLLLVPKYGMLGAALGTAVSMIFGYGIATNVYYQKVAKINLKLYYKKSFSGLWYAMPIAFLTGGAISLLPFEGFMGFAVKAILYVISYAAVIIILGLNEGERSSLFKRISKK